jgi:hypothetical protein
MNKTIKRIALLCVIMLSSLQTHCTQKFSFSKRSKRLLVRAVAISTTTLAIASGIIAYYFIRNRKSNQVDKGSSSHNSGLTKQEAAQKQENNSAQEVIDGTTHTDANNIPKGTPSEQEASAQPITPPSEPSLEELIQGQTFTEKEQELVTTAIELNGLNKVSMRQLDIMIMHELNHNPNPYREKIFQLNLELSTIHTYKIITKESPFKQILILLEKIIHELIQKITPKADIEKRNSLEETNKLLNIQNKLNPIEGLV